MNNKSMDQINVDPIFILNEKNTLITKKYIDSVLSKYHINHKINSLNNFIIATTHTSYCVSSYSTSDDGIRGIHRIKEVSSNRISNPTKAIEMQHESYERLEFLGDSIIHAVLACYIFNRFSDQQEGFMTKLRTKLENSETLAHLTQVIGLDTYILMSRYLEEMNGRYNNIHILEDVFEAFIGALYLDAYDFTKCSDLIIRLIESEIDIAEILCNETNYKDVLLQYAHTKKWPDPVYGTMRMTGTENKIYEMFVKINGSIEGVGKGNSKKKGEQQAAASALRKFRVIHDDSDCSDDEYICE